MNDIGLELVAAARHELGRPFRHHFKPNECSGGLETLDECMENGMDSRGYDCMGLVIASVCKINNVSPRSWPKQYRHSLQLNQFATDNNPAFGDVLLIESTSEEGRPYMTHMGFYLAPNRVLHANGRTGIVDEGEIAGIVTDIKVADTLALIGIAENIRQ